MRPHLAIAAAVVSLVGGGAVWWSCGGEDLLTTPTGSDAGASGTPWVIGESQDDAAALADAGVRSLRGRVVWGDGEAPLAGARVEVYRTETTPLTDARCRDCKEAVFACAAPETVEGILQAVRSGAAKPRLLGEGLTDAEGVFAIEGVPNVPLRVVARSPSAASAMEWPETEDEAPEGVVLLVLPSMPHAITVSETVVDAALGSSEHPLAGARVLAWNLDTGDVVETVTGSDGQVTVQMPPGTLWVGAEAPGFGAAGDFWTDDAAISLLRFRTVVVHTLQAGAPIEAEVKLVGAHTPPARTMAGQARFQVRADLDGVTAQAQGLVAQLGHVPLAQTGDTHVTLELRRAARLLVSVVDEAGQPVEDASVSLTQGDVSTTGTSQANGALVVLEPLTEGAAVLRVEVSNLRTVERHLEVHPGDQAVDVVMRALSSIAGTVVGPSGQPVPGLQVRARALNGDAMADATTSTGDDGTFHLDLEEPGLWLVDAQGAEGRVQQQVSAPAAGLTLALDPRATVEVSVLDEAGAPVEASCSLGRATDGEGANFPADAQGQGRYAGLSGGAWTLTVTAVPLIAAREPVTLVEGRVTQVTVRLTRGVEIHGRVVDSAGAPQAAVAVTCEGLDSTTLTDPEGTFVFEGVRRQAEVTVSAKAFEGEERTLATVRVPAPSTGVTLTVERATRVRGRLVGAGDHRPVESFFVADSEFQNPEGTFELETRSHSLAVSATGYRTTSFPVPASGDLGVVTLERLADLVGTVTLPSGQPAAGATVTADGLAESVAGEDGRFTCRPIGDLPPTRVSARLGTLTAEAPFVAGVPIRLQLAGPLKVRGRVAGLDGRGTGVVVQIASVATAESSRTETEPDGTFQVAVPPGRYAFSTRSVMGARVVDVTREGQEVLLGGGASACAVRIEADRPLNAAWLVPGELALPDPTDGGLGDLGPPAGAVSLQPLEGEHSVVGEAPSCGEFQVLAQSFGELAAARVSLHSGREPQTVFVSFPVRRREGGVCAGCAVGDEP